MEYTHIMQTILNCLFLFELTNCVQNRVLARIKAFCSSPYDRMNCIGPERLCERIVQTLRKDDGCESTLAIYMKYMLMIFVQY